MALSSSSSYKASSSSASYSSSGGAGGGSMSRITKSTMMPSYQSDTAGFTNYKKLSSKSKKLIRDSYEMGDSGVGMKRLFQVGVYFILLSVFI